MANDIVWYDSSETGAPALNNAAGSLDAVLYACLVTGFRTITLDSLSVASNVATGTYSGGHGFGDKRMVEISGATPSGLNGRKLVTMTGAGTFTFPTTGVADGAASGTITAKRSPLGWTRPASSGNVSIYQRSDVTATGMKLRVDDSGTGAASATAARWRMIEAYTDLSTFTGAAPGAGVFGGAGVYIPKGSNNSDAKKWVLVGDSRTIYLFTEASFYPASSFGGVPQGVWCFGDIEPHRSGDAYACLLAGSQSDGTVDSQGFGTNFPQGSTPGADNVVLPRPFNAIGSPVRALMSGLATSGGRRVGGGGPAYPSPVDNGVPLNSPILLSEMNSAFNHPFRGQLRGMADPVANIAGGSLHLQTLDTVAGSDRRWLLVGFNQQGSYGHAAFDITGPW
jgi:hypothetical protein